MRRLLAIVLAAVFLSGCKADTVDTAMRLRQQFQESDGCTFDAKVTADYGESLYEFDLRCQTDSLGDLTFTVTAPQSIYGITGSIRESGGALTFDDQVLAFELLADGQITPVSAPWILIHTLRSGYIKACSENSSATMLVIDDSYEEDALQLNIWLDGENFPDSAEIFWDGRKIISVDVSNFAFM